MEVIKPTAEEISYFDDIIDNLTMVSEMSLLDNEFLNSLVLRHKPKKILEVGVSAGSSSAIILNAIKDDDKAFLISADYNQSWYKNHNKKTGFLISEKFQHLSHKWQLYTGGYTVNFLEQIGGEIDFCLLDTVHRNPGEILDFLMILPFLKKNAVVVLHDVALHTAGHPASHTTCILLSAIKGKKIVPYNRPSKNLYTSYQNPHPTINNIGAVILDDDIYDRAFDYFNLTLLPWEYKLGDADVEILKSFFERHYDKKYVEIFMKAVDYNHKKLG